MNAVLNVCNMLLIAGIWFAIAKKSVVDEMGNQKIVPDVTPVAPKQMLEVKYGEICVNLGDELTPTQAKDQPTTLIWNAEPGAYYTLLFSDPDIPPHFNSKQFQHWLVINIPGNEISKGDVIFDYIGCGPPKGSGFHRYIFLVYKQMGKIDKSSVSQMADKSMADRMKYLVSDIVKILNLGDPVAGNFFKAQYDDYVPELHRKIGEKFKKE